MLNYGYSATPVTVLSLNVFSLGGVSIINWKDNSPGAFTCHTTENCMCNLNCKRFLHDYIKL